MSSAPHTCLPTEPRHSAVLDLSHRKPRGRRVRTPTRGRVYVQGAQNEEESIAVFSPPKPTPDVIYTGERSATTPPRSKAKVTLAGGPSVTDCKLEWGTTVFGYERKPVPCSPAVPYGADQDVSITLSNLPTEQKIHYRIVATNVNGSSYGDRQEIQPHAVFDLTTGGVSNRTGNSASLNASMNTDGMETMLLLRIRERHELRRQV